MEVLLGLPFYPRSLEADALFAAIQAGRDADFALRIQTYQSTGTAKAFNHLWSLALAMGERGEATHFAMLHADVVPGEDWLKTLVAECERLDADMVSAVVAIKDSRGITSTGRDQVKGDPWHVRRFAMTEILGMPETFSVEDTVAAGLNPDVCPLLVNTGCWVCDLRKPLWYELDEGGNAFFFFTMRDRLQKLRDGRWSPQSDSEDWDFSRKMASRGARYFCTRKVSTQHMGAWAYRNDCEWGTWKTDEVKYDPEIYQGVAELQAVGSD